MATKTTSRKNQAAARQAPPVETVPVFIMGKRYEVPSTLTIQKAMEYAGYQLVRGVGCRGGICGACATVYRVPGSYRVEIGLACQTVVKPNMHLAIMPFFPANKAVYDIERIKPAATTLAEFYPEVFKCIGCNTCTKSCPMDIDVMAYMANAIRGNIQRVAELSFDCVMCGLCSARCPAEEAQYNVAILARRLAGRHLIPRAKHLAEMVRRLEAGEFESALADVMAHSGKDLVRLYEAREIEPEMAGEEWIPGRKAAATEGGN